MTKNTLIAFILILLFIVPFVTPVQSGNYQQTSTNQCTTPTATLNLQAQAPDHYNVTSFHVNKDDCVAVAFRNADTLAHSFTIDTSVSINVSFFTIYIQPGQSKTVNFQAPNVTVTLKYYCAVPGHEANGMYGNIIVGSTTSISSTTRPVITSASSQSPITITTSPSFEAISTIFAIASAVLLNSKFRRKRK